MWFFSAFRSAVWMFALFSVWCSSYTCPSSDEEIILYFIKNATSDASVISWAKDGCLASDRSPSLSIGCNRDGRVTTLQLPGLDLVGTLSPALTRCLTELEVLVLNSNRLSGSIPASAGQLAHLRVLELSSNALEGTLPVELGGLRELETLSLGGNMLTGTVPPSFGFLTALTTLDLSSNLLDGQLPDSLASLAWPKMSMFMVHHNKLVGSAPLFLHRLSPRTLLSLATLSGAREQNVFWCDTSQRLTSLASSHCTSLTLAHLRPSVAPLANGSGGSTDALTLTLTLSTPLPASTRGLRCRFSRRGAGGPPAVTPAFGEPAASHVTCASGDDGGEGAVDVSLQWNDQEVVTGGSLHLLRFAASTEDPSQLMYPSTGPTTGSTSVFVSFAAVSITTAASPQCRFLPLDGASAGSAWLTALPIVDSTSSLLPPLLTPPPTWTGGVLCETPPATQAGPVVVEVSLDGGSSVMAVTSAFVYYFPEDVVLDSVAPASVSAMENEVTVTGSGFISNHSCCVFSILSGELARSPQITVAASVNLNQVVCPLPSLEQPSDPVSDTALDVSLQIAVDCQHPSVSSLLLRFEKRSRGGDGEMVISTTAMTVAAVAVAILLLAALVVVARIIHRRCCRRKGDQEIEMSEPTPRKPKKAKKPNDAYATLEEEGSTPGEYMEERVDESKKKKKKKSKDKDKKKKTKYCIVDEDEADDVGAGIAAYAIGGGGGGASGGGGGANSEDTTDADIAQYVVD